MCLMCLDKKALGSGNHCQAVSPVWYRTYHIATWWKGNSLIFAIAYKRILLQCSLDGINWKNFELNFYSFWLFVLKGGHGSKDAGPAARDKT